jgi:NAD(P)H dehydrogenase (quinone)
VAVTGISGRVGSHVARRLCADGFAVRGLTRNPPIAGTRQAGLTIHKADLDSCHSLGGSFEGCAGLVLITADGPRQTAQAANAITAARTAGIKRLVVISAMLAGETPPLSFGVNHARIEQMARESGLAWTILRPSFFMQTLEMFAGPVRHIGRLIVPARDGVVAFVHLDDVADAVAACLKENATAGHTAVLTGSEALSFGDVAAVMAEHWGRPIRHLALPRWLARLILPCAPGLNGWMARRLVALFEALDEGRESRVCPDLAHLISKPPRRLSAYLDVARPRFNLSAASANGTDSSL